MNRFLISILAGLVSINTLVAANPSQPKLVVGIVVDQLRTDYLEYLQSLLGDKGFRRLMQDGVYMRDVEFKANVSDAPTATAMLLTGSRPATTGVPEALVYNSDLRRALPALWDTHYSGNYTNETYSPEALLLSTLADEMMISTDGLGTVYSLSVDPQQAVIMAGHAGTAAFWINRDNGKWSSTSWYKDVPQAVSQRNRLPLTSRVDTMAWTPMLDARQYLGLPDGKKDFPFRHLFPSSDKQSIDRFAASPLANREITDLAIDCIKSIKLGHRSAAPDMLNIAYSVAPYPYDNDMDSRMEMQDAYLRLDRDLERLFEAIERNVGLDNTLVWLSSTGYYNDSSADDEKYRVPGGEVSLKRVTSLLNAYLAAKYGNGDYVETIVGNHLYLDRKQIGNKGLDVAAITADAREFLCKMSGISHARTIQEILGVNDPELEPLRNAIDPKTGGDIILEFAPGRTVVDDLSYPVKKHTERRSATVTPAFILSPGTEAQTISTPVSAQAIAPTVCRLLRIRSPNGAQSRPLMF